MTTISCLIVDDEPLALDLLEKYVRQTPFLELAGRCMNAMEALAFLDKQPVPLVFLDIQMPEVNGMELARLLPAGTRVIFTTAFDNFAIEGFKVNALDYLLKPFNYPEFLGAANKAREWLERKPTEVGIATAPYLFVRSEYKQVKVLLDEVLYFEGLKDYIRIWTLSAKPIMTLLSLKALEEKLPPAQFMRIHRSYIIALDKIQSVERNRVIISDKIQITVAENYKERFYAFINKRSAS